MEPIHPSHVLRYRFSQDYAREKAVLDAGCADGFGSTLLAEVALSVDAIDNDPALIAEARKKHARPNIAFQAGDVRSLPFPDNSFDCAVGFEIIEHFKDQGSFLRELRRVVKPDGIIIISTPDHVANMKIGVYELTFLEFFYLMNYYFDAPRFYGQFFYREPSFGDRMLNHVKRLDVAGLRKLIPRRMRDKHNLSVRVYEEDAQIRALDGPAVQVLAVVKNKKQSA
jgi:ubiquinone/menaquinone biosynthesis C-methylase UbiE